MNHLSIGTADEFNQAALDLFNVQSVSNELYRHYLELIDVSRTSVTHWREIPCLPVSFFKTHSVKSGKWKEKLIFNSSGTTGQATSKHYIRFPEEYHQNFIQNFRHFYGDPVNWCFICMLPSYIEQGGSSLVFMAEGLIKASGYRESGFYGTDFKEAAQLLENLRERKVPVILLGVTYALVDFALQHPIKFPELVVMETGGMKGRRREMVRSELHEILTSGFGVENIHSEYGMTELFSQAYSKSSGKFESPPWMRIWLRDTNDPLVNAPPYQNGGINVIDLANKHTCAFIAVQDLGRVDAEGRFEVLGRFDNSELRGCSLLLV